MRDDCIEAVTKAAGRALSPKEIKGIEDRIVRAQKLLASTDRQKYAGMSPEERLRAAAKVASDQLQAEASRAKQRVALTINAHERIANYVERQKAKYGMGTLDA